MADEGLHSLFFREEAEEDASAVALGRDEGRVRRRFRSLPVEARAADVTRPESLRDAFASVDTVIQCVQFSGFPVEDPSQGLTFLEVDGRGTRNVVESAEAAGVERIIYLSGVGADPFSELPWYRAKGLAERSVRESGMRHTIIRPSWIYGPEDRSLNLFVRLLRLNPLFFPQIGDGCQRLNPLFVEDLAGVVADIVESGRAEGETFELGGPVTYTLDEILRIAMEALELRRVILHFPVSLVTLVAAIAELLPGQLLSRGAVDFLVQEAVADNTRFRGLFSRRLTGLPESLRFYLACA